MATSTVYDIITDVIVKKLEAGVVPWHKPWQTFGEPKNLISGKEYRGINHFLLGCVDFTSPFFLTFKQAKQLGGHVRKGERSLPCIFWTQWEKERPNRETGELETVTLPVLRYYRVFNSDQCEDIDHLRLVEMGELEADNHFDPIEEAEAVLANMPGKPAITTEGTRAYYRPPTDTVNMPPKGLFDSSEGYYSTAFHELIHSTGHRSRLGRKGITESSFFGSLDYGQEELVAEMGAAFLCSHCRISQPVIDNQAAYLGSWLRTIRSDAKLVVVAAAQAQKAADFILGKGGQGDE